MPDPRGRKSLRETDRGSINTRSEEGNQKQEGGGGVLGETGGLGLRESEEALNYSIHSMSICLQRGFLVNCGTRGNFTPPTCLS